MKLLKYFATLFLVAIAVFALNAQVYAAGVPGQLTLSWQAPTLNTDGSAITGTITYNVNQYVSGKWSTVATGVTVTSYVVKNLTPSTPQSFYITATVGGMTSASSNQVNATVPSAPPPVPKPPTNASAQ